MSMCASRAETFRDSSAVAETTVASVWLPDLWTPGAPLLLVYHVTARRRHRPDASLPLGSILDLLQPPNAASKAASITA